jgi:cation transport regulator
MAARAPWWKMHNKEVPDVPYARIEDLPASVRAHLPLHAQEIFVSAFNHAWVEYDDRDAIRREETAFRVAWAAVKRKYEKIGDRWVERG